MVCDHVTKVYPVSDCYCIIDKCTGLSDLGGPAQAELSEDGGHSDDDSGDDEDAAEQEKLLVGPLTCIAT